MLAAFYCFHVLGAFEGRGVGAALLAHAAFHLRDGGVFVGLHPLAYALLDGAEMIDAVRRRVEQSMVASAPTMRSLITSSPLWMPLVAARLALTWPWRIPIQVSGRRMACGVLSKTCGASSRLSKSMSG